MSDNHYIYRARAFYASGEVVTRRFLTKKSRDRWAHQREQGYEEEPPVGFMDDGRPALEPALRVVRERSTAAVFEEVYDDEPDPG